ncbi:MAG TPA: enoyl-CoA hydratase [Xanthobacteraceae bacterium]|nr:enoyl-CoA hydratase [Xanthobacteraceae bacterium]
MRERIVSRLEERPRGRVAWLTIARAEKLNALDPETIAALAAAARALHADAALRAVVVTGAGARAFIGGADIATMARLDADGGEAFITALHEAIAAIRAIPVPVIARVNGYCLGAGLEVAAACDLRVASARAVFGMPEVKVGMPSVIEAALLPRLIGMGRTAELVLLGENIDADRALAIGLIEKVVPPDGLDAAVEAWIEAIVANGAAAVRLQKALMREWERLPLDQAVEAGIATYRTSVAGGEPQRMLAEFMARRRK